MRTKLAALSVLPPILVAFARRLRRNLFPPAERLEIAPQGWETPIPDAGVLDSADFVATEVARWSPAAFRPLGSGPLLFCDPSQPPGKVQSFVEQGQWLSFAYAFAAASRDRESLTVLDYGGHVGYCYRIARAVRPDIPIEYHCKELPGIAAEGRRLNPGIVWHDDDSCLDAAYDLVIMSGVLQYVRDWPGLVRRAASSANYVFLTNVSSVAAGAGYVAIQYLRGAATHYQVLSAAELLDTADSCGLRNVREFLVDEHPRVAGAAVQPEYRAWLFQSTTAPQKGVA